MELGKGHTSPEGQDVCNQVQPPAYDFAPCDASASELLLRGDPLSYADAAFVGALTIYEAMAPTAEDFALIAADYDEVPPAVEYSQEATFDRFAMASEEQGVHLHPGIMVAGRDNMSSLAWSNEPHSFLSAITEVGVVQRTLDDAPLVSEPVVLPPEHETLVECGSPTHVFEAVLTDMINATLQPAGDERPDRSFSCVSDRVCGVCEESEPQWAQVFAQMKIGEGGQLPDLVGSVGYQIIEDNDGQAIMVRKAIGVRSTLVVAEGVTIDGMPVPPGSLLHTEAFLDKLEASGVSPLSVPSRVHSILPSGAIAHATLLRLSSYVVNPDDRLDFFATLGDYFPDGYHCQAREALLDLSMWDIRQLTQDALERLRQRSHHK